MRGSHEIKPEFGQPQLMYQQPNSGNGRQFNESGFSEQRGGQAIPKTADSSMLANKD